MIRSEEGFLLLCCSLGDLERRVLTTYQLRKLAQRMRDAHIPAEERELGVPDLLALGYGRPMAERIVSLFGDEDWLQAYLRRAKKAGCVPITRVSDSYPQILRAKLGLDAPGCLWAKGDLSLLERRKVSLVGSRDLLEPNRYFCAEAGSQAAKQGYALVSGNARGADQTAQNACLRSGGQVISIVADSLETKEETDNLLFLSEDAFDLPFSGRRALSRNRLIHAMGEKTFVGQCSLGIGGTWDGTVKNLSAHLSPVFCYEDGSEAAAQLAQMGAQLISLQLLQDFSGLKDSEFRFM